MRKILRITALFVILTSVVSWFKIFGIWSDWFENKTAFANVNFCVGSFSFNGCICEVADLIIDDAFYDKYMYEENGNYYWKKGEYNEVINFHEISNLTPLYTIIKRDICYEVITPFYNLVYQGLPSKDNPLDWALMPICLNYVPGWAYRDNRVVKLGDDYYMARFYTTADLRSDRRGWDKIEPVCPDDFYFYEGTCVPNYSYPKLEKIRRAYNFDNYTTYHAGDIVIYEGIEYRAIVLSNGHYPNNSSWAWEEI